MESYKVEISCTIDFATYQTRHNYLLVFLNWQHSTAEDQLKAFDNELKLYNPPAYQRCGELTYRKHFNYKYVKDCREGNWHIIPSYYRALCGFLNLIGGLKVSLVKL